MDLKVYYSKPPAGCEGKRKKFLYATVINCDAELSMSLTGRDHSSNKPMYTMLYATGKEEVHLTTDSAFELYKEKRLCVPRLCIIYDTIKQLEPVVESMGYVLCR